MRERYWEPVTGRKATGRPVEPARSENICVRLPESTYEEISARAAAERVSLSAYVRRVLIMTLHPPPKPTL